MPRAATAAGLTLSTKITGDAMIPLMLISLGVRMATVTWGDWNLGVLDPIQQGLLILFGSLPPAVLNFMVAEQYNQEPAKVASIVLIGNIASLVFIPLGLFLALH